ncbi:recombinase family protein [Rhodomicrobium sp. Az07]|nr:recombinase family protein [Rhodomicrobium sp. Az07]
MIRKAPQPRTFGYARVSTADQDLTIQQAALEGAGCLKIFSEKKSGTRRDGRTELSKDNAPSIVDAPACEMMSSRCRSIKRAFRCAFHSYQSFGRRLQPRP